MPKLKFQDDDTGESIMYVVIVPEGVSLQMSMSNPKDRILNDYISVILNPKSISDLIEFLNKHKLDE